jgi:hypothetical protein
MNKPSLVPLSIGAQSLHSVAGWVLTVEIGDLVLAVYRAVAPAVMAIEVNR